ncbi:MAG: glycosyl hydrolase-related protein [Chloroflexi bacterium]|nr:glycosyl hydrolase-related protein [Chloroflexota bacterium]
MLERWAEPFAAFQALEHAAGERLPGEAERRRDWARNALRQAWKYLLQNQPHDSICGCSIDQVHDEMRPRFDWVDQIGGRVTERSLTEIAALANTELPARHGERMRPLVVFNPSSRDRTDFVTVRLHVPRHEQFAVTDHCGRSLPSQVIARRQTELFSTEVQRAELTRVLAGMPGDDPDAPERFAAWALHRAHATDAGLGLAGASVADGPRHESARLDLTVEAGRPHDLGAAAEALNALRSLADRQAVELLHLRVYRPAQEEVELGFLAPDVPGHGYRTVAVVEQGDRVAAERPSMVPALTLPHTHDQASPVRIENDLLAVEVDAQDGTLTLTDKLRCAQYAGFVRFADRGDAGDEYNFSPPKRDRAIGGYAEPPEVRLVESGPARWTVRIAGVLRLPVGLASQRRCRSAATIDCPAVTSVSLSPGVARVDIRTEVDNRAEDHRLRVLFPTGIQAETAAAESHFGVTERPLALPAFGPDWTEDPVGTFPQKTFVDVTDGFRGLAVANRGLPEYEVMPTEAGAVIALTLLRCVGWLSRDDLATRRGYAGPARETPGAQMLGRQTFEYALIPHGGDWEAALGAAHDFTLPLRAAPTGLHSGPLPSAHQFIRITPPSVVVSAVKLAENGDGLMVRLYNPTARSVEAIIAIAWPLAAAHLTDMEEHPGERLEVATDGRSVGVTLGPSKIVTVRLTMG